jgi:hypothetical protein
MNYLKTCTLVVLMVLGTVAHAQPVSVKLWRGETYITLTKDTTLTWSVDTAGLRAFIQGIIDSTQEADSMLAAILPVTLSTQGTIRGIGLHPDSALAYRNTGSATDTSKLVSMDRDDLAIRGEKTFGGELAVVQRLGIGTSTLPVGTPTRFHVQHDSASMRSGEPALKIGNVSSTETWSLYESGIIAQPLQSCVRAYRNTTQSLTGGLDSKIEYNALNWDKQYEFDTGTNHEFVARTAGVYLVSATAAAQAGDTNYVYLTLYKNSAQHSIGGIYQSIWNGFYHYSAATVNGLITLAAGDALHIRILSNIAATLIGNTNETHLSIVKLL